MALEQEALEKLLSKQKTKKQVVKFFAGASEADRKQLAPFCLKWLKEQVKVQRALWKKWQYHKLLDSANYAAYACCSFSVLKPMRRWVEIEGELAYQLLSDRKPDWLDEWAEMRAEQGEDWDPIRKLVREGLCRRPRHDNYTRAMIHANPTAQDFSDDPGLLNEEFWRVFEVPDAMRNESFFGILDARWHVTITKLVQQKVIERKQVFERCFSALDMGFNRERVKFFFKVHDTLKPTLDERQSMLPAYCGMLQHSFPTVIQFGFDCLETLDKLRPQPASELSEALRAVFRQPTKRLVTKTLRWLGAMLNRDPAARRDILLVALEGLCHEKTDIQADAWKFVVKNVEQDADVADVAEHAALLVRNASPTVRKEIQAWLDSRGESASVSESTSIEGSEAADLALHVKVAKTMNTQLAKLLGVSHLLKAIEAESSIVASCCFDGTELARLPHAKRLPAIDSLDELLETAARVQEDGIHLDDGDRVIEALARFNVRSEPEARKAAEPILKRAAKLFEKSHFCSFVGAGVHRELRALLLGWGCSNEEIDKLKKKIGVKQEAKMGSLAFLSFTDKVFERAGFAGFLGLRNQQILKLLYDQKPFRVIGAATHSGGWIDPRVLVERTIEVARNDFETSSYDEILSLLRLAPDYRKAALKLASKKAKLLKGEYNAALLYALGGDASRKSMKSAGLWVAAARARSPWNDDPLIEKRFPDRGPDAGRAAIYKANMKNESNAYYAEGSPMPKPHRAWTINQKVDWDLPTVVAHEHDQHCDLNFGLDTKPPEQAIIDAAATVWPIARESYFRVDALDDLAVHLKPLFDPSTPLREMSNAAISVSLGSGYAEQRTLAIDVAIACIDDGRFDPQEIGRMLAQSIRNANRLVKSLPEVAAVSALHSVQVTRAIIAMLAQQPKNPPSAFGALLQVLLDLLESSNCRLEDKDARDYLAAIPGTGKAAKLAKKLLRHGPEREMNWRDIQCLALAGRLACDRQLAP